MVALKAAKIFQNFIPPLKYVKSAFEKSNLPFHRETKTMVLETYYAEIKSDQVKMGEGGSQGETFSHWLETCYHNLSDFRSKASERERERERKRKQEG